MHFSLLAIASLFAATAIAGPIKTRDNDHDNEGGLKRICPGLRTMENGCVRCKSCRPITPVHICLQPTDTKGFDVTGVVTEVDLTFPTVKNECDCIQQCLDRPSTCANYVFKFSTPASVQSGHRTCTLYSQFNLPSAVVIDLNLNSTLAKNINAAEIMLLGNNPQAGAPVPQTFKDVNLNTIPDTDAVSG